MHSQGDAVVYGTSLAVRMFVRGHAFSCLDGFADSPDPLLLQDEHTADKTSPGSGTALLQIDRAHQFHGISGAREFIRTWLPRHAFDVGAASQRLCLLATKGLD